MLSRISSQITNIFIGKPPKAIDIISKNASYCHNKYVKGQKNKQGNPISSIYSDHPNWNNYRKCMDKTKKEQKIMDDYTKKSGNVRKIVIVGVVGCVLYGVYWLGTKNK